MISYKARKSVLYGNWYLINKSNNYKFNDDEIASLLDMDVDEYRNIMVKHFNGYKSENLECIAFKKPQHAESAIKYLNNATASQF